MDRIPQQLCIYCGGDPFERGHWRHCDGQQGAVDAAEDVLPQFDGDTYDPAVDENRLRTQLGRVYALMIDGRWRRLAQIQRIAGGTEAAISARLRDLRKAKFGGYDVQHRRVPGEPGLWEYRLILPEGGADG